MAGIFYSYQNEENEYIDTSSYGNYYRPKKKPNDKGKYLVLLILTIVILILLWLGGFLNPGDKELKHMKVMDRVCEEAVKHVTEPEQKIGIYGANIPGRVIYIRLNELMMIGVIESNLKDYRTGELISASTDIKLEVLSTENILCSGFAFPEDDRIIPEVFLIGNKKMTINKGETFIDPGAYATDNRDGNITHKIVRSGTVDVETPGTYHIHYVVKDRAGNLSEKETRIIIVK